LKYLDLESVFKDQMVLLKEKKVVQNVSVCACTDNMFACVADAMSFRLV
jgi:hypothetical protein